MTRETFLRLLDAYGADVTRWPDERQHEFLQNSSGLTPAVSVEVAAARRNAEEVDRVLNACAPLVAARRVDAVANRVLQQITEPIPFKKPWWAKLWRPEGAILAGLALGGLATLMLPPTPPTPPSVVQGSQGAQGSIDSLLLADMSPLER
ncbi:MAG: hypothetical protein HQL37_11255 [Alphaproteobacteria bacterium]|nr:hypothetical protein [Alphaproteobacteria bacterium]